jgi:cytochrome c oxidase assembly protein subunit 15
MPQLLVGSGAGAGVASRTKFTRYAWAVLGYNVFVIVWGALVRASGSGAGCGNHWPLCQGQLTPALKTVAMMIEFLHRSTSGIDTLLVAGLIWWAWRAFPHGHPVRQAAAYSGVFLVTEALLGASLVIFGWVENNASLARAVALSVHLLNTLTLLACLTLTAWWTNHRRVWPVGVAATRAWVSVGAMAALGITGALAALADTLYPVKTFAEGAAQDFSGHSNIYIQLRSVHPIMAIAVGIWLVYFATSSVARNQRALRLAFTLAGIVGLQLLAGAVNVMLAAPVWMQLVHLSLADALWVTLVVFCANLGDQGRA